MAVSLEFPCRMGKTQLFEIKDKSGAVLHRIDARRLDKANLTGLVLRCANLTGVGMTRINLRKADLCEADLSFANLASADLEQAILVRANLNCAMLIAASLAECDLREANLRHASMFQANLRGARLERASLLGADLSGVDLSDANLMGAVYDARTRWPDGFDPLPHGAILKMASRSVGQPWQQWPGRRPLCSVSRPSPKAAILVILHDL